MNKPLITLDKIQYTPPPYEGEHPSYTVYVVNGAHNPPWGQGHIYCSGCGAGHHYRYNANSPWVQLKCPVCKTVFAWFDDLDEEDDE